MHVFICYLICIYLYSKMMNNNLVRRPRSPTSLWRPSETAWECLLEASTCSQNMGWSAFCPFLMPKGSLQRGSKQRKRKCNGKWKILDCTAWVVMIDCFSVSPWVSQVFSKCILLSILGFLCFSLIESNKMLRILWKPLDKEKLATRTPSSDTWHWVNACMVQT